MSRFLLIFIFLLTLYAHLPDGQAFPSTLVYARTTPADIYNEQLAGYENRLKTFSPTTQQKIKTINSSINATNKKQTDELETLMEKQGQILDEYMRRNGLTYRVADGVSRNLTDPVENANYWITYAHEAVAYQAAKNYLPSLSSESNWKNSMLNEVGSLQSDINILKGKVTKSQNIVEGVVNK